MLWTAPTKLASCGKTQSSAFSHKLPRLLVIVKQKYQRRRTKTLHIRFDDYFVLHPGEFVISITLE
jgi:hypothetical protein